MRRLFAVFGNAMLALMFLAMSAWGGFALWFQTGGSDAVRGGVVAVWLAALLVALWLAVRRTRFGLFLIAVLFSGIIGWWWSIEPRLDRDWAPDVARTVTGTVNGDIVTLDDVRDFGWRSETEADERWVRQRYDLAKLTETDLVLSYWGIDAIAHTLVSSGFSDGRRVVFSVEIRRERDEEFSSIAGFFKVYELALIAAEERDILRLRTNMRGEDTYLYPLALAPEAMRGLFLEYVETGNALAQEPSFYDTLTANCTTVIFDLARAIQPGIPMDWRILLSGYLPSYLIDQNVLLSPMPEAELRRAAAISAKAKAAPTGVPYSDAIRSAGQ